MPLRWYGPFSDLPRPSGRYWPYGESLFHSVDLSFRTAETHARVLEKGLGGVKVIAHDLLWRDASPSRVTSAGIQAESDVYEFTHALYVAAKAMKEYLRHTGDWVTVSAADGRVGGTGARPASTPVRRPPRRRTRRGA